MFWRRQHRGRGRGRSEAAEGEREQRDAGTEDDGLQTGEGGGEDPTRVLAWRAGSFLVMLCQQ